MWRLKQQHLTVRYVDTETAALDSMLYGHKQQHLTVHYVDTETAALDSTLCGH